MTDNEDKMTGRAAGPVAQRPRAISMPAAEPAAYGDDITPEQLRALRAAAPQDASQMGPILHELTW